MVEVGTRIVGVIKYIPKDMLTDSVPGQIYELVINTDGIGNPEQIITILQAELPRKFKRLKVKWIRIDNSTIRMQIEGSPFSWALLLAFLPTILETAGVVVLMIAIYLVWVHVPGWVIGMLIIGAILTYFGEEIAGFIIGGLPEVAE